MKGTPPEVAVILENQQKQWDQSYCHRDNFLFYPHEEVIRFVSKFIRKRVGLSEFKDVVEFAGSLRLLDLGCGIGRHVIYGHKMGLETYGIDLSQGAIDVAREWARQEGVPHPEERLRQGDIRQLPWSDHFFDFVVSHGVLDSMHFSIAQQTVPEVHRVLAAGGLFYCDLISGDDSAHAREYSGEEIVETQHEQGTIQSYFNHQKIRSLFDQYFEIVEAILIKRADILCGGSSSRYHLTLKKK
jgi:SAM-dependent methyltransferase